MNAPYDGDRGRAPANGSEPPEDPQVRDAYTRDPVSGRESAHEPHGGSWFETATPPQQRPVPYTADRPAPAKESEGLPSKPLPYGDDLVSHSFGRRTPAEEAPQPANSAVSGAGEQPQDPTVDLGTQQNDAFAHLFRDQGRKPEEDGRSAVTPPPPTDRPASPVTPPNTPPVPSLESAPGAGPAGGVPDEPAASASPPKSGGLLKSSAIMAAGTMVSRLTGFIRSAMIVAAVGAAVLGDSYQLAITLPTMLYVLTVGGGLNSVFVPQLVRAMKDDNDGGEAYANRLLTLVTVILGALCVVAVLAAPLLVRAMSVKIAEDPQANEVAVTFVRYCLPSIFFMGVHVVMGQILNARGRFGAMMWTPVLNNIVIIATVSMFLWVYGTAATSELTVRTIPPEGVRLLGIGTLLGLVVQALAMIPYLRAAGFRVRPRFDWRGHGLGKAARLAKWTILFVLANQAGVLVVSQLSTWAGDTASAAGNPGTGYIAYSNAQLIWNMPQAIITVSVMAALLPRLSRAASDGDNGAVRDDISQGLRNSAVAIVPIAFGFLALGIPMCTMIYGSSGLDAARSMGYALMAFGLGLIPFSVQYVVLRAFYAYEDTRTPFFNTVIVAGVNAVASALCFFVLPARWAVVGMAFSYGLAYVIGVGVAWRRLRIRLGGDLDGSRVLRTYIRLAGASIPATLAAGAAAYGIMQGLGSGVLGSVTALFGGAIVLGGIFVLAGKRMRIEEITAMVGMVRARLGR